MEEEDLVSIITPSYNCLRFVEQTIRSVLSQTYRNWEMLIQDDCSTDGSMELLRVWAGRDPRIKVEQNRMNSGAAVTRNNAIKRSNGKWLAFLDSDDVWLPDKLEVQLTFMKANSCDFSFTRYEEISEDGVSLLRQAKVCERLTYWRLAIENWPGCLTVMYKQDVNNKVLCRDVKKNNDQALFLQAMRYCNNAMGMDRCTALYRIRRGGISRNKFKMIGPYIRVIHEFEGHSIFTALFCMFSHTMVKCFFKFKSIKPEESVVGLV